MIIQKINQKHKLGCAVACVAMLANVSYNTALKIVHPFRQPGWKTYTPIKRIFIVLQWLYFNPKYCKSKNILSIEKPSILIINTKRGLYTHAVVWDPIQKRILDPARNRALPLKHYQKQLKLAISI